VKYILHVSDIAQNFIVLMVLLCSNNQTQIPKELKPEESGIKIQSPKALGLD